MYPVIKLSAVPDRSPAQAVLKLKQQLLSEVRHKKGGPRSAPITPVLERLRQEDHRFEPSSIIKSCIEEKGDEKEREEGRRKGVGLQH